MIVTWSSGDTDANMPEEIVAGLADIISRHPWWQARAELAMALLKRMGIHPPARVLDAACGWGVNLIALERSGYRATGLDISRRALEHLDQPGRELIEADLTQPLPTGTELYDAVLALDVIEHLDDDRGAVARLARLARPGGIVIVSVPALPELFSEFDSVQGHRRRYLPETLRDAFVESGLLVEEVLWWGAWMVPILKRTRKRSRGRVGESPAQTYRRHLELPPWPASLAFRLAFALEHRRTLHSKLRVGTSLFALSRRAMDTT